LKKVIISLNGRDVKPQKGKGKKAGYKRLLYYAARESLKRGAINPMEDKKKGKRHVIQGQGDYWLILKNKEGDMIAYLTKFDFEGKGV